MPRKVGFGVYDIALPLFYTISVTPRENGVAAFGNIYLEIFFLGIFS